METGVAGVARLSMQIERGLRTDREGGLLGRGLADDGIGVVEEFASEQAPAEEAAVEQLADEESAGEEAAAEDYSAPFLVSCPEQPLAQVAGRAVRAAKAEEVQTRALLQRASLQGLLQRPLRMAQREPGGQVAGGARSAQQIAGEAVAVDGAVVEEESEWSSTRAAGRTEQDLKQ